MFQSNWGQSKWPQSKWSTSPNDLSVQMISVQMISQSKWPQSNWSQSEWQWTMGLVKLMTQCVVIGNCETVENCACDRKLLSVHCGADCTFSARFLSWCPRPAISFKGHQYLYFALSMELIFNFQDKTSQKLRNCPNSRYSKYSRYSSIVKFGRNCEIWSTPISLVWKGQNS